MRFIFTRARRPTILPDNKNVAGILLHYFLFSRGRVCASTTATLSLNVSFGRVYVPISRGEKTTADLNSVFSVEGILETKPRSREKSL